MSTRIQYLRDPRNHDRVLTIVSRVDSKDSDIVEYGFAMNRPSEWRTYSVGKRFRSEDLVPGDRFNKAKGRMIATARLNSKDCVLTANCAGRKPMRAVLETLRDASDNSAIRRICGAEVDVLDLVENLKETGTEMSPGPHDHAHFKK